MGEKRKYTEEERQEIGAVAIYQGVGRTAKMLDVPQRSVVRFKGRVLDAQEIPSLEQCDTRKKEDRALADSWRQIARKAAKKLNEYIEGVEILKPNQAREIATVGGISVDKSQVLMGEPTERIEHTLRPDRELLDEIHQLQQELGLERSD